MPATTTAPERKRRPRPRSQLQWRLRKLQRGSRGDFTRAAPRAALRATNIAGKRYPRNPTIICVEQSLRLGFFFSFSRVFTACFRFPRKIYPPRSIFPRPPPLRLPAGFCRYAFSRSGVSPIPFKRKSAIPPSSIGPTLKLSCCRSDSPGFHSTHRAYPISKTNKGGETAAGRIKIASRSKRRLNTHTTWPCRHAASVGAADLNRARANDFYGTEKGPPLLRAPSLPRTTRSRPESWQPLPVFLFFCLLGSESFLFLERVAQDSVCPPVLGRFPQKKKRPRPVAPVFFSAGNATSATFFSLVTPPSFTAGTPTSASFFSAGHSAAPLPISATRRKLPRVPPPRRRASSFGCYPTTLRAATEARAPLRRCARPRRFDPTRFFGLWVTRG